MSFEFTSPQVATLKFKVGLNANKSIAQLGEIITGYKVISIKGFKADGSLVEAQAVLDNVMSQLGGGTYDLKSVQKVITEFVADNQIVYIEIDFTADDINAIFSDTFTPSSQDLKASVDSVFAGTYQVQNTVFSASDFNF